MSSSQQGKEVTFRSPEELDACYVYGIVNIGKKLELKKSIAIDSRAPRIYSLPYRDISALISKTVFEQFDPSEENMLAHNAVLEEAHSELHLVVLPLRFSTIVRSEPDVLRILQAGYSDFKRKISRLSGREEVSVKAYADVKGLSEEVRKDVDRQRRGDMDKELQKKSHELASKLFEALKGCSEQSKLGDIIFADMIMNGTFLIKESDRERFMNSVKAFDEKFGKHLKIKVSGPYVPYSFAVDDT